MRVVQSQQMTIGEVDVSKITFDPKSRDDIPKILHGLQYLYMEPDLRASVFELLKPQWRQDLLKSWRHSEPTSAAGSHFGLFTEFLRGPSSLYGRKPFTRGCGAPGCYIGQAFFYFVEQQ